MRNDLYVTPGKRRKKSKLKTALAALLILVLAFGVSTGVFLFAKDRYRTVPDNLPDADGGVDIAALTVTPVPTEDPAAKKNAAGKDGGNTAAAADGETAADAGTDTEMTPDAKNAVGPYSLWIAEEKKEIKNNTMDEKAWMADFVDTRTRVEAKGCYLSASYINKKFNDAVKLVEETELNAVVIDIKDDSGYITYQMDNDMAKEIGATTSCIYDMPKMLETLHEKGIYVIARIVTLKDPLLAKKRPDLALKNKDGTLFKDNSGLGWVNPYLPEVWEYLESICVKCVEDGFDEVNLDYIRFSTDKGMANVDFGEGSEDMTRIEVISKGIKGLCETVKPLGAFISCDVYGAIITSSVDAKIVGQAYREMARYLDYICPMVYPSHYGFGYYGLDYPDNHPYELVKQAMEDSKKTLSTIADDENKAIVRPWLQDFTASWLGAGHYTKYGVKELRDQIDAVYDAGYNEWLLWNAGINYTEGALKHE